MPVSCFLLFLCFRSDTQEIFSELDETKARSLIFPGSIQTSEERKEKGHRPPSQGAGAAQALAAPPLCENASELFSVPVSSCDFVSMYNFRLYNPPDYPRSVYHFLVVFCFELFLSGDCSQL